MRKIAIPQDGVRGPLAIFDKKIAVVRNFVHNVVYSTSGIEVLLYRCNDFRNYTALIFDSVPLLPTQLLKLYFLRQTIFILFQKIGDVLFFF